MNEQEKSKTATKLEIAEKFAKELTEQLESQFGTWNKLKRQFGNTSYGQICKKIKWKPGHFSKLIRPLQKDSQGEYPFYQEAAYNKAIKELALFINNNLQTANENLLIEKNKLIQQLEDKKKKLVSKDTTLSTKITETTELQTAKETLLSEKSPLSQPLEDKKKSNFFLDKKLLGLLVLFLFPLAYCAYKNFETKIVKIDSLEGNVRQLRLKNHLPPVPHQLVLEHFYPTNHKLLYPALEQWSKEINDSLLSIKINTIKPNQSNPKTNSYEEFRWDDNIHLFHTVTYYARDTYNPIGFFSSIPFGMDYSTFDLWFYGSGGITKYEEYINDRNHSLLPLGNTGPQAEGWFLKEINSINDLETLKKIRIFGLGGKVLDALNPTIKSISEFPTLEVLKNEFLDLPPAERSNFAFEYVNAYTDSILQFPEFANIAQASGLKLYFYANGQHEPSTLWSLLIKNEVIDTLRKYGEYDLFQSITTKYHRQITRNYILKGAEQLNSWQQQEDSLAFKILPSFPKKVQDSLKTITIGFLKRYAQDDEKIFKPLFEDYADFHYKLNGINLNPTDSK